MVAVAEKSKVPRVAGAGKGPQGARQAPEPAADAADAAVPATSGLGARASRPAGPCQREGERTAGGRL